MARKSAMINLQYHRHGAPFGNGYYEHFDPFCDIATYIDEGILQLNFIYRIGSLVLSISNLFWWEEYYGIANPLMV
jgi:hypothetical protein